jgi:hypothetical protein
MALIHHWSKNGRLGDYDDLGHIVNGKHCQGEMVMDGGDLFWGDVRLPTGGCVDEEEDEEQYWECDEESYA